MAVVSALALVQTSLARWSIDSACIIDYEIKLLGFLLASDACAIWIPSGIPFFSLIIGRRQLGIYIRLRDINLGGFFCHWLSFLYTNEMNCLQKTQKRASCFRDYWLFRLLQVTSFLGEFIYWKRSAFLSYWCFLVGLCELVMAGGCTIRPCDHGELVRSRPIIKVANDIIYDRWGFWMNACTLRAINAKLLGF